MTSNPLGFVVMWLIAVELGELGTDEYAKRGFNGTVLAILALGGLCLTAAWFCATGRLP